MFENFKNHRCLDIVVVTVVVALVFVFVQNPRRMGSVTSQSREPGMTGAAGISNCDWSSRLWWKETRESVRVFGEDLQAASEIRQI